MVGRQVNQPVRACSQIRRYGAAQPVLLRIAAAVQIGGYLRVAADQRWLQAV